MLKKFNELNSTTYLSASDKATKYGQYNRAILLLEHNSVVDRKSAVLLSKIILKANPNSKYKNVNNIKIESY